jgi:hypothetical protein
MEPMITARAAPANTWLQKGAGAISSVASHGVAIGLYDRCLLLVFASRNRYSMNQPPLTSQGLSRSFAGGWDMDRTIERFENEPSRDAASAG